MGGVTAAVTGKTAGYSSVIGVPQKFFLACFLFVCFFGVGADLAICDRRRCDAAALLLWFCRRSWRLLLAALLLVLPLGPLRDGELWSYL